MKLSANQFRTPLAVPKENDLTEQVKVIVIAFIWKKQNKNCYRSYYKD